MSKKKFNIFLSVFDISIVTTIVTVFLPLPVVVLKALLAIELVITVAMLICSLAKFRKALLYLALCFGLFSLVVNVGLTKTMLIELGRGDQAPIFDFVLHSFFECNYIVAFGIAIILFAASVFFMVEAYLRIVEASARFIWYCDDPAISEPEKKSQFYSNVEKTVWFLSFVLKATVFISAVHIIGGIAVAMIFNKVSLSVAFKQTAIVTSESILIFLIPQLIVFLAMKITFNKKKDEAFTYLRLRNERESQSGFYNLTPLDFLLRIGYGLLSLVGISFVDTEEDPLLITSIRKLRETFPELPKIHVTDDSILDPNEYAISWKENEIKKTVSENLSKEEKVTQIIADITEVYKKGSTDTESV